MARSNEDSPAPNPIDVHVGSRVRLRRKLMGISQEKLALKLGLTFQQVQKYERGTNRISASKLYEIARALGVSISDFFDGLDQGGGEVASSAAPVDVRRLLTTTEGLELAMAFGKIRRARVRQELVDLVKTVAAADGPNRH